MRHVLPLLAAFACQPVADDKGRHDGSDPTDEVPYDGCAPTDEIPYDGVDQDCDGADVTDVDEDGHDAALAGGDDCDDEDPSAYPDAEEVQGDGIDQDCDGWTDEWDVCEDGSGDFTGIQEAIDGTSEAAPILVLCPGTWHESVVFEGLDLTVAGGGDAPDDVVWQPGDSDVLIDAGEDPSTGLHLEDLYLVAEKDLNRTAVTGAGASFTFERVGFDGFGSWANWAVLLWAQDGPIEVEMSHVYLANAAYGGLYVGGDGRDVDLAISASVFDDNGECDVVVHGLSESYGDGTEIPELSLSIANSVFAAPAWRSVVVSNVESGEVVIENNTFVGAVAGSVSDTSYLIGIGYALTETRIASNEFVDLEARYLWTGWWCPRDDWDCGHDARGAQSDAWPDEFVYNLGWNAWVDGLGVALLNGDWGDAAYSLLSDMEAGITTADPGLSASTSPPWANPDGGAGVNAGDPDTDQDDPDGSRNDAGAYGGPAGDWWQESPWLSRL